MRNVIQRYTGFAEICYTPVGVAQNRCITNQRQKSTIYKGIYIFIDIVILLYITFLILSLMLTYIPACITHNMCNISSHRRFHPIQANKKLRLRGVFMLPPHVTAKPTIKHYGALSYAI